MAKKFVRGVTGIEDIESYDKTLTNVNDIISDGQDTFVHTKKGKTESYYKLTDSLKSVTSDNSDLITVTKDNTTNTSTIHPKHDAQKEQSLESTRGTVSIQKGANGTNATTKVDTNPQKVLEHNNLLTDYGISKSTSGNTTKLGVEYTKVADGYDLNSITSGFVRGYNLLNSPTPNKLYFYETFGEGTLLIQIATASTAPNAKYIRLKTPGGWGDWREQITDKSAVDALLSQKQNTLSSNSSIGVLSNNQLRQLYYDKQFYTDAGKGLLKTYVKNLAENTTVNTTIEEYNFIVKINPNVSSAVFTLKDTDKTRFNKIMTYSTNNTLNISGCVLTLSGSTLTVTTKNNTEQAYIITFSDILD